MRVADLLDEKKLTPAQMATLLEALLDVPLPNPTADWPVFSSALEKALAALPAVFDVLSCTVRPWAGCTIAAVKGH